MRIYTINKYHEVPATRELAEARQNFIAAEATYAQLKADYISKELESINLGKSYYYKLDAGDLDLEFVDGAVVLVTSAS